MQLTADAIPADWEELRSLVELACGPTVIVGGALRDLDNNRAVKDLDLFVLVPPLLANSFDPAFYEAALRRTVPGLEVVQQLHTGYAEFRDEVFHVTTCRVAEFPYELQVIFTTLETPQAAVERVDFGMCQIGWDGEALIRTTAYYCDRATCSFTLLQAPSEHHRKRSIRRFERFVEKYPGWRFREDAVELVGL